MAKMPMMEMPLAPMTSKGKKAPPFKAGKKPKAKKKPSVSRFSKVFD